MIEQPYTLVVYDAQTHQELGHYQTTHAIEEGALLDPSAWGAAPPGDARLLRVVTVLTNDGTNAVPSAGSPRHRVRVEGEWVA